MFTQIAYFYLTFLVRMYDIQVCLHVVAYKIHTYEHAFDANSMVFCNKCIHSQHIYSIYFFTLVIIISIVQSDFCYMRWKILKNVRVYRQDRSQKSEKVHMCKCKGKRIYCCFYTCCFLAVKFFSRVIFKLLFVLCIFNTNIALC